MAILTIDFDEDDMRALSYIIPPLREDIENGDWSVDGDEYDNVIRFIRVFHESIRAFNKNTDDSNYTF
jgi:hypothetical protein